MKDFTIQWGDRGQTQIARLGAGTIMRSGASHLGRGREKILRLSETQPSRRFCSPDVDRSKTGFRSAADHPPLHARSREGFRTSTSHSKHLSHATLLSNLWLICRFSVEDWSWGSSDGVAGHRPRSRRARTCRGTVMGEGWSRRGRGRQLGRQAQGRAEVVVVHPPTPPPPRRSRTLAQSGAHIWLAGHGATRPSAETAAGTGDSGTKAITAAAPRASRVALPGALRLRPWRCPALPRPS